MVALGNATMDGTVIFAKNSDRQPNEPHIMVRVPRKKHKTGDKLKCTYIEIDQVEETYEVLLLKPSWIWGCEMGSNEFGLNIGNEAVFTREKQGPDSLIGMDFVRLSLERCRTAEEALHLIVRLLERYGQGGNCGYKKNFTYHNSYLIADRASAWVLETAGQYWAAEKVSDIRSISNCLTIGSKFDLCHEDLIKHAVDKGWCRNEKDFNFAACYGSPLYRKFSGSPERWEKSRTILEREKGNITVDSMKKILRSHEESVEGKQFTRSSLKSVCMHGGFVIGDHTTGSYIASIDKANAVYWVTGSSTPCIAVFKPLWLIDNEPFTFSEDEEDKAVEYWKKRESLHRLILSGRVNLDTYLLKRDNLEAKFQDMITLSLKQGLNENRQKEIMDYAKDMEESLLEETINSSSKTGHMGGSLYFKSYWKKENANL
jgi:Dipeptidase